MQILGGRATEEVRRLILDAGPIFGPFVCYPKTHLLGGLPRKRGPERAAMRNVRSTQGPSSPGSVSYSLGEGSAGLGIMKPRPYTKIHHDPGIFNLTCTIVVIIAIVVVIAVVLYCFLTHFSQRRHCGTLASATKACQYVYSLFIPQSSKS